MSDLDLFCLFSVQLCATRALNVVGVGCSRRPFALLFAGGGGAQHAIQMVSMSKRL